MEKSGFIDLEVILDLMQDAVCVVDKSGVFVFVSAAFEKIFGYKAKDVVGQPMLNYVYPEDHHKTLTKVASLLVGDSVNSQFENRWVRKDGQVVYILWSVCWSEEHQVRIAVAHDITERKKMEDQLYYMAGHDVLTGLPNRSLLMDSLQATIAKAQREGTFFSVFFIDVDSFKAVNDNYGHSVGDMLLQSIAKRLLNVVREYDTVGRFGGDEFLIILEKLSGPNDAVLIKNKMLAQFQPKFKLGKLELTVSASIGIANYPNDGVTKHQLIKYADQAMYKVKRMTAGKVICLADENIRFN